jgi:hypothetical protein
LETRHLPLTQRHRATAIILGIAIYFLPYSPRELAGKSKDQRCLDVLVRLRNLPISDPRIQAEWITIRAEAVHNREAFLERHPTLGGPGWMMELKREIYGWIDLFKPGVIRRTHVGMGIAFFQQFCGVNAVCPLDGKIVWLSIDPLT